MLSRYDYTIIIRDFQLSIVISSIPITAEPTTNTYFRNPVGDNIDQHMIYFAWLLINLTSKRKLFLKQLTKIP